MRTSRKAVEKQDLPWSMVANRATGPKAGESTHFLLELVAIGDGRVLGTWWGLGVTEECWGLGGRAQYSTYPARVIRCKHISIGHHFDSHGS